METSLWQLLANVAMANGRAKLERKDTQLNQKHSPTKSHAEKWSRLIESEMDRGIFLSTNEAETTLFSDLVKTYKKEVVLTKKSQQDLLSRIKPYQLLLNIYLLQP